MYSSGLVTEDLKYTSFRLSTLLALATGQRVQTLSLIKCLNIKELNSGIKIYIPEPIKTSGPNRKQPCLDLPNFSEDPSLCVASLVRQYLKLTKDLRSPDQDQLFITFKKPHKPASKQTISRWIKTILKAAGVDTSIFTAHSTRHASTSAALRLDIIKKSASWSKDSSTFAKFYNRPLQNCENLLTAVFST